MWSTFRCELKSFREMRRNGWRKQQKHKRKAKENWKDEKRTGRKVGVWFWDPREEWLHNKTESSSGINIMKKFLYVRASRWLMTLAVTVLCICAERGEMKAKSIDDSFRCPASLLHHVVTLFCMPSCHCKLRHHEVDLRPVSHPWPSWTINSIYPFSLWSIQPFMSLD